MSIGAYDYDCHDFDPDTDKEAYDQGKAAARSLRAKLRMARAWIADDGPIMKRERILEFIDYSLEQTGWVER